MSRQIELTQGKVAIVDDCDFQELSKYKWRASKSGPKFYAIRHRKVFFGKREGVLMHREIMDTPIGYETDHINGDTLDNRRSNLRTCNASQNNMNKGIKSTNTSGYKGVSRNTRSKTWRARIAVDGRQELLGCYESPEQAARAYDKAAKKHHGIFAWLNFGTGEEDD